MAAVNKIDSNVTGLRYAEETALKTLGLGASTVWQPLEPNSYNDFGGNIVTIARTPISADRQRKKGAVTDIEAAGGFNTDLTQTNLQDLLQGFFFASLRRKGEEIVTAVDLDGGNADEYEVASTTGFAVDHLIKGSGFSNASNNAVNRVTVVTSNTSVEVVTGSLVAEASPPADATITVVGHHFQTGEVNIDASTYDLPRLVRASGSKDFTTFGLIPGEFIFIGGDGANTVFDNSVNNGFKRIRSIAATYIEFDKSASTMVNETGADEDIQIFFGRCLKNETGSNIIRRTYQLERDLGAPDTSSSNTQAEYITGAVPNEFTLNFKTADKVNCDLSFVATDHETVTAGNQKVGTRPSIVETDAFNTSSDFSRIKMAAISSTNESPSALFAFVTEMTLTINNNVSTNKAIGTVGAFDATAGIFQVGGQLTAYFSDVASIAAVKSNTGVTLDIAMVKNNKGIVVDLPLLVLSDARATVEQDSPIVLPMTSEAASGAAVNSALNHTLMMVFFDYLPNNADV